MNTLQNVREKERMPERQDCIKLLPHKYPFVMVDRVLDYKKEEWIRGAKYIGQETAMHWGNYHIMLCESLAQLSKILDILSAENPQITISFLTSIKVDFLCEVREGDTVVLFAKWTNTLNDMNCFEVEATVDSNLVLTGSIYRKIQ